MSLRFSGKHEGATVRPSRASGCNHLNNFKVGKTFWSSLTSYSHWEIQNIWFSPSMHHYVKDHRPHSVTNINTCVTKHLGRKAKWDSSHDSWNMYERTKSLKPSSFGTKWKSLLSVSSQVLSTVSEPFITPVSDWVRLSQHGDRERKKHYSEVYYFPDAPHPGKTQSKDPIKEIWQMGDTLFFKMTVWGWHGGKCWYFNPGNKTSPPLVILSLFNGLCIA